MNTPCFFPLEFHLHIEALVFLSLKNSRSIQCMDFATMLEGNIVMD